MTPLKPPTYDLGVTTVDGIIHVNLTVGEQLLTYVLNTREALVREELIKLGWTPPQENTGIPDDLTPDLSHVGNVIKRMKRGEIFYSRLTPKDFPPLIFDPHISSAVIRANRWAKDYGCRAFLMDSSSSFIQFEKL